MSHETRIQHKSSFLTEQLVEERARKTSFETRGMAVISASGTLVGITTGAVALAASGRSVTFPESARLLLVAGHGHAGPRCCSRTAHQRAGTAATGRHRGPHPAAGACGPFRPG
ncbi:hypothetical protein IHE61_14725 [Streptomyces sp. GKU 257-1]|nr:hypothetical protein [Streptomyces sp. GKU 257-1]